MKKLKLYSIITAALMTTSMTIQGMSINAYAKEDGELKVQMYNSNTDETTKSAGVEYNIKNTSKNSVDLSKVKVRYYYTADSTVKDNFYCDNASVISGYNYTGITSSVKGEFVKLDKPMKDADHYLEIGFSSGAGILAPDAEVRISSRFAKNDWRSFNQKNDYSFKDEFKYSVTTSNETYADWNKTALFVDDTLVSGEVPSEEIDLSTIKPATVSIDMYNGITDKNSNTLAPRLKVTNTSDEVVDLSKLKLNYYFTSDGEEKLNFFCDHAAVTSPVYRGITSAVKGSISNYDGGDNKDKADKKLEISFGAEAGILEQGESMEIQTRVSKENWTNFDQENDFSFDGVSKDYSSTDKVTAFINSNLVYGNQPTEAKVEDKDSVISPIKAAYDKKSPAKISTSMTLNGNTLLTIMNGETELVKDKDYTVNDDKVVFTEEYLSLLEKGSYNFTFNFDKGNSKNFELSVVENEIVNKLSSEQTSFVEGNAKDVTVEYSGNELNCIKDGETTLEKDKDYVVEDKKVTFSKEYLNSLKEGDKNLTFDFNEGEDLTYKINVTKYHIKDSVISPLRGVYDKKNPSEIRINMTLNGNELLSIMNGDKKLEKDTDYTVDGEKVVFTQSYLDSLNRGTYNLTFNFNKGNSKEFELKVDEEEVINDLTLEAGKAYGKPGDTVTIPVTLKSISKYGLDTFDITINYDNTRFENVSLEPVNIPDADVTFRPRIDEESGVIKPSFMNNTDDDTQRIFKDGVLFNIKMKIKEDAKEGSSVIKCKANNSSFGYWPSETEMETYKVNDADGSVEITSPGIENKKAVVSTPKITAAPGETFVLPVNISTVPKGGVSALVMDLKYDNKVLEAVDYKDGGTVTDTDLGFFTDLDNESGIVGIGSVWGEDKPLLKPATVVYITFKVKDDAEKGTVKLAEVGDTVFQQNDETQLEYDVEIGDITIK